MPNLQVRAAFGLLDPERKGWVTRERLQACFVDASFRYYCLQQMTAVVLCIFVYVSFSTAAAANHC